MNDGKKDIQTNMGEYAGPPKSREFQNKTSAAISHAPADGQAPKITLPEMTPEDVQLSAEDILENPEESELLRLIAAGDRPKPEKKKKPFFDLKKLEIKELTEFRKKFNKYREENIKLFHQFNSLWAVLKLSFYLVGLSFFAFCFFVFFSFEPMVRTALQKRGLTNITFGSIDYSLSEFTMRDVKDKNGMFTIGQIKVQYTVADLLERKLPLVEIDSMKIYIQENANAKNTAQNFIQMLWKLGFFDRDSLFSIQSLRLDKSVLNIGNKEYTLPVTFSGVGSLGAKKQIVLPINLQNRFVNLKANLTIDITSSSTMWTMDIVSGTLTFGGFAPQDLRGTLALKTKRGKLNAISYVGSLTHDKQVKNVEIQVSASSQGRMSMKSTMTIVKDKAPIIYSLNLSNISVAKDFKSFQTSSPAFLKISNFKAGNLKTEALQMSSNGLLKCNLDGCSYKMLKRSDLILFGPSYPVLDTTLSITYPLRLTIEPAKDFTVALKNKKVDFDISFNKMAFDVRKKSDAVTSVNTNVGLDKIRIFGSYDLEKETVTADFSTIVDQVNDSEFMMTDGALHALFKENGFEATLNAKKARFKEFEYFKPEFAFDLSFNSDYYFTGSIETPNKQLSADINGYYHPYTSAILMAVQTKKPVVFKNANNSLLPQDFSSLFSDDFSSVTGSVSVKGQIHYKGNRSISGPLKVMFDDMSFTYGNTKVKNLNAVLDITQLVPFGAQGGQNIFASSVSNIFPFEDVKALVFFDSNRKQFNISSLSAKLGGYQLLIDPMWYTYASPVYNFVLKGKSEPVQSLIDGTRIKNLQVKGKGNISLSMQQEGAQASLKTFELSVPNEGMITYTPAVYPNPYLENLKALEFKKLSVYLTQQDENLELVFSSDNKSNKLKKKTNFRFTIKEPLEKFLLPSSYPIPENIQEEKENF